MVVLPAPLGPSRPTQVDGATEKLRQILLTVTERFEFMCATLEKENPYFIFKSLNSTGVRLDLWGPLLRLESGVSLRSGRIGATFDLHPDWWRYF